MSGVAHEEYVLDTKGQAWRIQVKYDEDYRLEDCVNDAPCIICTPDRYNSLSVRLDTSTTLTSGVDYYNRLTGEDIDDAMHLILEEYYESYANGGEEEWTEAQMAEALVKAHLWRADIKRAEYRSRVYQGDGFVVIWSQKEMDAYCGTPDQTPGESIQHYLDGDVYGYIVEPVWWVTDPTNLSDEGEPLVDESSEDSESCWGFVGEESYCLGEARDTLTIAHTFTSLQGLLDFIEGDDTPEG